MPRLALCISGWPQVHGSFPALASQCWHHRHESPIQLRMHHCKGECCDVMILVLGGHRNTHSSTHGSSLNRVLVYDTQPYLLLEHMGWRKVFIRRDTILLSLLVHACLLCCLFAGRGKRFSQGLHHEFMASLSKLMF